MNILDELKKEAEKIIESEEVRLTPEEQQAQFYEHELKPALLKIYRYVQELIEQLDIIKPEINITLSIPGVSRLGVRQRSAGVNIDSLDHPMKSRIKLDYFAEGVRFRVPDQKTAGEALNFLNANNNFGFEQQAIRAQDNSLVAVAFVLNELKLTGNVSFRADPREGVIRVGFSPFYRNDSTTNSFKPSAINDEWLNHLGMFLTGKEASPLHAPKTELSEEQINSIRDMVENEKAERQKYHHEPDEEETPSSLLAALNKFKTKIK